MFLNLAKKLRGASCRKQTVLHNGSHVKVVIICSSIGVFKIASSTSATLDKKNSYLLSF